MDSLGGEGCGTFVVSLHSGFNGGAPVAALGQDHPHVPRRLGAVPWHPQPRLMNQRQLRARSSCQSTGFLREGFCKQSIRV